MAHWECRYCDRPAGYMGIPIKVDDEEVCACGAEWADAKILVEDDEVDEEELASMYDDDEDLFDSDLDIDESIDDDDDSGSLDCGCCPCCGCSCYDYEDDCEEED